MADVKDELGQLIDEEEETPPAPTAGKGTGEGEGKPEPSEEELTWSSLKGSTQDRIRQLIRERNEWKEKALAVEEARRTVVPPAPPTGLATQQPAYPGELTPEQKEAIETLRRFGIVTKDDLQAIQDQIILDAEYARLERLYDGSDGRPAFNREEIEEHMRNTGIFNPEKAYEDLYKDELFDWRVAREREKQGGKPASFTEKPTPSAQGKTEPLSVESIRERLSRPDGKIWWEKNRAKILPVLGELTGTTP